MRVNDQGHAPTALPLGERALFHCSGDCMGPRPSMEKSKSLYHRGLNPATDQPVPSRYTNYAILDPSSSSSSSSS
jgi:hypothetical protein